jgi:hypothetical protein
VAHLAAVAVPVTEVMAVVTETEPFSRPEVLEVMVAQVLPVQAAREVVMYMFQKINQQYYVNV